MKDLAVLLRAMQLYAHNCHNLVTGPTFMQDHAMFSEIYDQAEGFYDNVVERMIGKGLPIDLIRTQVEAAVKLKSLPVDSASNMFMGIKQLSDTIKQQINSVLQNEPVSEGIKQLIGDIYDKIEVVDYKLKQRLSA